jgi:arginase family enzyme
MPSQCGHRPGIPFLAHRTREKWGTRTGGEGAGASIRRRVLPAYDRLKAAGPVYISFDTDVLDPAFAPGVSHREPGGMSVREVIAHLHAIKGEIVGADIVEYNPVRDIGGMTATVTAKILKEILGKMIAG